MEPQILFIPKHVERGMSLCNVDYFDLADAIENNDMRKIDHLIKSLSKIDIRDMINTDKMFRKTLFKKNDSVVSSDSYDVDISEVLTTLNTIDNNDNDEKIKDLYNIMSSDKNNTTLTMDEVSKWLSFKRVNKTFFIFVENDFIEFFIKERVLGSILFYRVFINMLYLEFNTKAFDFYYFNNFLNFLIKNQRK